MPKCGCCGKSFNSDSSLVKHLIDSHDWDELSRIDRKRIETQHPAAAPDSTRNAQLPAPVQSIPVIGGLSRRQLLGLTAGVAVAGGVGVTRTDFFGAEEVSTESLMGQWEIGPSVPYLAEYPAVATYNDSLYIFGGGDDDRNPADAAYRYDPEADSWAELAPMPVEGRRTSASVVDDRIYVIDGSTEVSLFGDGTVRIYDPETDSWSLGTNRPVTSRNPGQATDGEQIYLFGGNFGGENTDFAHVYDPESDSWEERTPMPFANRQMSCHYIPSQERIYLFGGESPGDPPERDDVITYDPETDSYDDSPTNMPEPSQTNPSTVHEGKVLFPGGEEPGGTTGMTTFRIYDPEIDAWDTLPDLLEMVESTGAGVVGDRLVVPGGRTYFEPDADLDEEPHTHRYDDYPVFFDRTQVYRFET